MDGKVSPKPTSEWDDQQKKEKEKKYMVIMLRLWIFFMFNHVDFTRVRNCKTVYEISKLLEVTLERINQIY